MKIYCFKDFRQPEYLLRRTDCHRIRWGTNRCNCRPCFDTKPCDRKHLAGYIHRRLRYKRKLKSFFIPKIGVSPVTYRHIPIRRHLRNRLCICIRNEPVGCSTRRSPRTWRPTRGSYTRRCLKEEKMRRK